MAIGEPAFESVAVEQRGLGGPAQDERELPCDIRAVHERRIDPFAAHRARKMPRVAEQESPPVAQRRHHPLVHAEVRDPPQIGEADVGSNSRVEQRGEIGGGRRPRRCGRASSRSTKMRNRPSGSGASSTKPPGPTTMRARPGGAGSSSVDVRDDEAPAVGFAVEALLHRMTRHAVAAVRADQIAGPDDLLSPALVEGHGHAVAIGRDRRRLDAELDLKPPPRQMVAQHGSRCAIAAGCTGTRICSPGPRARRARCASAPDRGARPP